VLPNWRQCGAPLSKPERNKQYLASIVTVELAPDVARFFPNPGAADEALRELMRRRGIR
jgi:hypothetical protein